MWFLSSTNGYIKDSWLMKRPGVEKCISEKDCDDHRVKVNEIGLNIQIKCYKLHLSFLSSRNGYI